MNYLRTALIICIMFSLQACGKNTQDQAPTLPSSLGEVQSVWNGQKQLQKSLQENTNISAEQKKLFEISNFFQTHALEYDNNILETLKKYNSSLTQEDIQQLKRLLSENLDTKSFKEKVFSTLSIEMLESDIKKLKASHFKFMDEKNVQKKRLLRQEDLQTFSLIESRDILIENMIHDIISSKKSWTQTEKEKIIHEVLAYFYQNNYSSEIESFTQIIETLENQYTTVINTETITSESYDFDQLSFIDFIQNLTQQYETTLSYSELIEEYTQYITHEKIRNNVITEIQLIESEIPLIEYETIMSENTTQLESIFKTKEIFETLTIEETESYFSKELDYSDIEIISQERQQNLADLPDAMTRVLEQEYIDDSALISNLTPLAYIEELEGNNVVITNLSGGEKSAAENMLLYAGYTIKTSGDSTANIIFSDESILRLEKNSQVTLIETGANNPGVDIAYGNIWTRVIKPLFSQDAFIIDSQDVSLAVRGTSVYLQKSQSSGIKIYVVNSYTEDGTPSLELTNKVSGANITLSPGKVYEKTPDNTSGSTQDFERISLMQQEQNISKYLRDDLRYLSLTLDDRKRGFYNNPLSDKNDSQNFLDKLSGELEATIPTQSEATFLFVNSETPKTDITAETIYMRLVQDELITDVENSSSNTDTAKILAIKNLDIKSLEKNIGNLREIENRLDLNISQEIIDSPSNAIEDIFIDFGLSEAQAQGEKLHRAKEYLIKTLNNGSPYISADIALVELYDGVDISWKSSDKSYLGHDGIIAKSSTEKDIPLSLTATLRIGNQDLTQVFPLIIKQREPTDEEKLETAYQVLLNYINTKEFFTDEIGTPDFNSKGSIIPTISWATDEVIIDSHGTIKQPVQPEKAKNNYKVKATLRFGNADSRKEDFELRIIEARAQTDKEKLEAAYNVLDEHVKNITLLKDQIPLPDFDSKGTITPTITWEIEGVIISEDGKIEQPFHTEENNYKVKATLRFGDAILEDKSFTLERIERQAQAALDVYEDQDNLDAQAALDVYEDQDNLDAQAALEADENLLCAGKLINEVCYDLVASAEYDGNSNLTKTSNSNNLLKYSSGTELKDGGILVPRGTGAYLSYDLSTLDLGDNWAIEMSVRGEDLGRYGGNNGLLSIPGSIYIYQFNGKLKKSDASGKDGFLTNSLNGYQNILLTKEGIFLNSNKIMDTGLTSLGEIKIGSHKDNKQQWNGIINYVKILKKKD